MERVKAVLSISGLMLLVQAMPAQEKKPWIVDRVCGRIEFVHQIPEKKHPTSYSEHRKGLQGVPLDLYLSSDNQSCCDGLKSVGSLTSGKNGQFEFKPENPGQYWLRVKWNGKDYRIAVMYEPAKKPSTICSEQGIQIEDDRDAGWWTTVTVD